MTRSSSRSVSAEAEIYLDWNATSPPHPEVLARMARVHADAWANPSSVHAAGRRAWGIVEQARDATASLLGVRSREVVFTSGATEANNLALYRAPALVTSYVEHASVTRVGEALARQGTPVEWLGVSSQGVVDLEGLELVLRRLPRGTCVAMTAACHETGVLQPLREAREVAHRHGARLHVDAVQALGKIPPEDWAGHADTVALSVHKARGPKGIGVLAWRCGWSPEPLMVGGEQERGLRPGTLSAALAAGLDFVVRRAGEVPRAYASLAPLRDRIEQALGCWGVVNGSGAPRLPHVTNLSFPGWYSDELVAGLDLLGVCVSAGSACSAGSSEPARAVRAMVGPDRARSALRISLGETTESALVATAIERFCSVLARGASGSSCAGIDASRGGN